MGAWGKSLQSRERCLLKRNWVGHYLEQQERKDELVPAAFPRHPELKHRVVDKSLILLCMFFTPPEEQKKLLNIEK